ncbi:hypothetical protein HOLleu_27488 [Holothuria leucospilota]|uniref:Uncharacterized protein n=1 Tax=Holothuria leucospilota TaxID=206669 RepID=A0A9Q1BQH2_HOLLE|nr:hypothetical protein HOLleu_27488 [Holothuria leucospilota]
MEFTIGTKVQAVDELGRWENGKIIARNVTTGKYHVSFSGWGSEFDVDVSPSSVRKPIDPAKDDYADIGKRPSSVNRRHLAMLRTLCKGDAVKACIDGVEETVDVVEVDRFERTVVVEQQEQGQRLTKVKACLVTELEDETISEPPKKRTVKKRRTIIQHGNTGTTTERMTFFKCPQTEVEVGEVVEATPLGIKMAVKEIYNDGEVFRCGGNVVNDGSLTDFALSGPVEKVKKCDNYKVAPVKAAR